MNFIQGHADETVIRQELLDRLLSVFPEPQRNGIRLDAECRDDALEILADYDIHRHAASGIDLAVDE